MRKKFENPTMSIQSYACLESIVTLSLVAAQDNTTLANVSVKLSQIKTNSTTLD